VPVITLTNREREREMERGKRREREREREREACFLVCQNKSHTVGGKNMSPSYDDFELQRRRSKNLQRHE
jgi:hypothetical protein